MADRLRAPRFRWLVPVSAVSLVPDTLESLGFGSTARGLALSLLIGTAAGAFWYAAYPRPLVDRLTPLALWGAMFTFFVGISAVLPGSDGRSSDVDVTLPGLYVAAGVLCALVLSERGRRWRKDFLDEKALLEERDRRRVDARAEQHPN